MIQLPNALRWIYWPGLFLYFYKSKRARVLLLRGTTALLMQDSSSVLPVDTRWSLPGGGINRSELPVEGARRELLEELGIDIPSTALTLLGVEQTGNHGLRYTGYFYVVMVNQNLQLQLDPKEVARADWIELSSLLPAQMKVEVRQAIQLYSQR